MTRDEFWDVIAQVEGIEEPEVAIVEALEGLTPAELISYQEHFDTLVEEAYRWNLWGAAYIMEGGCSDDSFMDFRYGLISLGREVYEEALKDPDSLADIDMEYEISNELFGYAAQEVYEEMEDGEEMPRKTSEQPQEPIGTKWDFDNAEENAKHLPKLWVAYGEDSEE